MKHPACWWSRMLVVIKKTCFYTVTISLQLILKDQKLVLNSVFSHLVFSLIPSFFRRGGGKLLYGKPFSSHNKLHKNVGTFKKSQSFTICINLSLKFLNISWLWLRIFVENFEVYIGIWLHLMQLCKVLLVTSLRAEKKQNSPDHFHFFVLLTFKISLQ